MKHSPHHQFIAFFINLYQRFAPPGAVDPDSPHHLKEQVLYSLTFLSVSVGLIILAASFPGVAGRGYWATLVVGAGAYISGLIIFLIPSLSYQVRSLWVCTAIYAMGASIILSVGPFFASREWLFSFSIIAAIMLGWAGAIASITINAMTFILIGVLLQGGFWRDISILSDSLAPWFQTTLDLFFLNLITTVGVAYIFQRMEKSDRNAKEAAGLLLKERNDLIRSRKLLKAEIEERKRIQAKVTALRSREKKVLDSIAAGIFIVSRPDKSILYANSTALSMLEAEPNTVIGRSCNEFLCPSDDCFCPIIDEGLEVDQRELEPVQVNGKSLTFLKTAIPISFDGQECLLETFVDISDRRRLENQLIQSQKMEAIGTLAGGVAHDFNNILSTIIGFTELSLSRNHEGGKTRNYLEKVLGASHRAKDLVQQLLSFSRKNEPEKRSIRIGPVIEDEIRLLSSNLPASISLRTDLKKDLRPVIANPDQLRQVLINLWTNALEAMNAQTGVLGVELTDLDAGEPITGLQGSLPPGRYVVLRVTDTGRGIKPENLRRIFEPFYTTKEAGQGSGMGLAVVHGIVAGHDGLIKVESEKDRGSRFSVCLQASPEGCFQAEEEKNLVPAGTSGRILLVGHGELLARPVLDCFEGFGYRITVYSSGHEALEAFQRRPEDFDILITDMVMPGLSGVDLAKGVIALRPDLPVVLCPGQDDLVTEGEALSLGIARFLSKPLNPTQTASVIRDLLAESSQGGRG